MPFSAAGDGEGDGVGAAEGVVEGDAAAVGEVEGLAGLPGPWVGDDGVRAPVNAWLSFTVVGPDILQSDVFATACFAMGTAGLDFVSHVAGYEGYAIDNHLRTRSTSGFDALCETVAT